MQWFFCIERTIEWIPFGIVDFSFLSRKPLHISYNYFVYVVFKVILLQPLRTLRCFFLNHLFNSITPSLPIQIKKKLCTEMWSWPWLTAVEEYTFFNTHGGMLVILTSLYKPKYLVKISLSTFAFPTFCCIKHSHPFKI